jgi:branched-chain amino acid transport system substrate-binding protein
MFDETKNKSDKKGISRRRFIQGTAAIVAAPAILKYTRSYAANPVIKIGYVSPQTGPLAGFGEADDYTLTTLRKIFAGGIKAGNGKTYSVEIIAKDSQSNPNRAAEVASELILKDKVDIITAASTPDTTNPVADQAELNGVPCITSDCPWQPYFFGRGGKPDKGFEWTYHFFWGLEDVIGAFLALWGTSGAAKSVGGLFPNDADGNAWGDKELGFPKPLAANGFKLVDPGRYQPLTQDFSAQISAFKNAGVEIVTGVMIPPDFANFWSQAAQQGFKPKVVTVGKALLFPSVINSLGDRGNGLTTEIWWSPNHPFKSSLSGESAKTLADGYTKATKRPWTQPIGFRHAMFEVAADVIKRCADMDDSKAILSAIKSTKLSTIVGTVDWSKGPVKNVSKTPLVSGQWQKAGNTLELVITNNQTAPEIPVTGKLKLL